MYIKPKGGKMYFIYIMYRFLIFYENDNNKNGMTATGSIQEDRIDVI